MEDIPKSHLKFNEFAHELEALDTVGISEEVKWKAENDYLQDFFGHSIDEFGKPYYMKHITAPRGSLILWDSRTVHWNQHPIKDRPYSDSPKVRMVGYLCYVPKARLTNEGRTLRREAFETGVSTGHNPAYPNLKHTKTELKYTKDHFDLELERYLEDPNYIQPKINLSSVGKSLLD